MAFNDDAGMRAFRSKQDVEKSVYISAILQHIRMFFISVWSARIDLRNEIFILSVLEVILIKMAPFISQQSYNVLHLSMKCKDWSTKWDIHFECTWSNFNKNGPPTVTIPIISQQITYKTPLWMGVLGGLQKRGS